MTFQNLSILPKSEFFHVKKGNEDELLIQQLYRVEGTMPLIVEQFGRISNGTFIDQRDTSITSRRRHDLFGLHLKASMVITDNDTLEHLTDYR